MAERDIRFRVVGVPVAQPRAKATRRGKFASVYTPDGPVHAWRSYVSVAAAPLRPATPIETPVDIELAFVFPRPKAHYRANGEVKPNAPWRHTQRPDVDNLAKAILDELTNVGYWRGDEVVARLTVTKMWGEPRDAGVHVSLWWQVAR